MKSAESDFSPVTLSVIIVVVTFVAILIYRMTHSPEERASEFVANFYGVPSEKVHSTCDGHGPSICKSRYADNKGTLFAEVTCGVIDCKMGL